MNARDRFLLAVARAYIAANRLPENAKPEDYAKWLGGYVGQAAHVRLPACIGQLEVFPGVTLKDALQMAESDRKLMLGARPVVVSMDKVIQRNRGLLGAHKRKAHYDTEGEPLNPYLARAYADLATSEGKPPGRSKLQRRTEQLIRRETQGEQCAELLGLVTRPRIDSFLRSGKGK